MMDKGKIYKQGTYAELSTDEKMEKLLKINNIN